MDPRRVATRWSRSTGGIRPRCRGDTLTMLRMALFVLHEQRPYLAEHPGAIDAYEAGLTFWKRHYGKQPIRSVPSHLAAGPAAPGRSSCAWSLALAVGGEPRALLEPRRSGVTWSARVHAATSQGCSRWRRRARDSWHRRAPARGNRLSRAAGLPRLAGSDRPLQAERDRRVLAVLQPLLLAGAFTLFGKWAVSAPPAFLRSRDVRALLPRRSSHHPSSPPRTASSRVRIS